MSKVYSMERHSITIDEKLYAEIASYCKINGEKISTFCSDLLRKGFMEKKYGDIPFGKVVRGIQKATEEFQNMVSQDMISEALGFNENETLVVEANSEEIKPENLSPKVEEVEQFAKIADNKPQEVETITKPKKRRL